MIFNAFAYSMLVTQAPQFVGIYGKDEDGEVFGHALIAYRIEDNKLYVSDPNFPAWSKGGKEERAITFNADTGEFEVYSSGATADDTGDEYDRVLYFGYKDLIDWDLMGELWEELEDGLVGVEEFPRYELAVRQADSEAEDELWTNYESEGKDIVVRVRDHDFIAYLDVLDANGKRIGRGNQPIEIELKDGDNWLGFTVYGGKPAGGKIRFRWVGFDWIKVIYESPEKPTPTTVSSTVNPPRWIRVGGPVINANGAPLAYYGGGSMPDYYAEARFEGKFVVYSVSETAIAINDREVDFGFEYYNVTIRSTFDAPPPVLTPGESHPLTVNFVHSGTVAEGNPGARFQYRADASHSGSIQPSQPFPYWPWSNTFSGETARTWTLVVPQGRPGDTFQITASWWNCPVCDVTWTYQVE
ncbi:MAG: hypothetical protein L6435_07405 [Anaerolineae bacterium]|nr:hypothetical protein [Anaerolineae bacterium]